jgi:hypothetical protein
MAARLAAFGAPAIRSGDQSSRAQRQCQQRVVDRRVHCGRRRARESGWAMRSIISCESLSGTSTHRRLDDHARESPIPVSGGRRGRVQPSPASSADDAATAVRHPTPTSSSSPF